MDENRKIIIPIGGEPDESSSTSFFDTQAKNSARPVVPLTGTSTMPPAAKSGTRRKLLGVVIFLVAAISAAVAAFVYINMTRGSGKSDSAVAVRPVAGKTLATLPWTHTPEDTTADGTEAQTDSNSDAADKSNDSTANDTQAKNQQSANAKSKTTKAKDRGKSAKKKDDDLPEDPLKRTQDELNRIRDIFEGPPPP